MKTVRRRLAPLALVAVVLTGGFLAGRASADQPRMQAALEHLERAEENLENATNDKGGHRARALRLVREALSEVRQGIRFDRRH
jgi:hypothetical protein